MLFFVYFFSIRFIFSWAWKLPLPVPPWSLLQVCIYYAKLNKFKFLIKNLKIHIISYLKLFELILYFDWKLQMD